MCKNYACEICEKNKTSNIVKDGKIPIKEQQELQPFDLLSVDLCGPWKCRFAIEIITDDDKVAIKTKEARIWALTMIDEVTMWPEIAQIQTKESAEVSRLVDRDWFCRYPRPLYCIHDNGKEFFGREFEEMLSSYGVKSKPTTVKNPQSNGVHERVHLVLCEMLRTQELYVPVKSTESYKVLRGQFVRVRIV